ncbi:MAG: hypothetical protein PHX07_05425 [Candidatus Marinimicrobia bacterium]|nr:hypothetical protein [Candidatus Neomarinimicrobiota bacterium]MDD4961658.1 hypothetical protein [Candidatus Neomarinimicrobiota bacterium]
MPTPLQKGKLQRLRISQYYADGGTFVVRLLLGLGIYISLRILLSALIMKAGGISYEYTRMPVDVVLLLISALLLLASLLLKGSRLQFAASLWMPALLGFSVPLVLQFGKALLHQQYAEAFWGILPQLFFMLFFVLIWLLEPQAKKIRIPLCILLAVLSLFWISDIPKSLKLSRDLQSMMMEYRSFYEKLGKEHAIPAENAPLFLKSGDIQSSARFLTVDPGDYRIDPEYLPLKELDYVTEITICLPGPKNSRNKVVQELQFRDLQKAKIYYFYKYSLLLTLRLGEFRYSGDVFFRAVPESGETYYLDYLIVRKK